MKTHTPQSAVQALRSQGMLQGQIVSALAAVGVTTTQETVSRIGSGAIKRPSFDLGSALIHLAESNSKAA